MSETKCAVCNAAVYKQDVVDGVTGNTVTQLVNAGDGKFHACPAAKSPAVKPPGKPAAAQPTGKPKAAAQPKATQPTLEAKPVATAEAKPVATAEAKPVATAEAKPAATRLAAESNDVLCETAIDIMAQAMKMKYEEMYLSVTKCMMHYGLSRLEAVKFLAHELNVDLEKQGAPVNKVSAPAAKVAPGISSEDQVVKDCDLYEAPALDESVALTNALVEPTISDYSEDELDRGVEIDFESWAAGASRSFLSVEKATKENLTLKFIKGGKVIKRRSKFEQEVRDKDGNVVFELDNENKPVMEGDGKGGFKPKIKKQRPIQDWVPVSDKAGVEYLLNVNPGMRKMLGKFKNDAGGTFDCWFKLKGEGRGKAYKCEITPVKE